MQNRRKGRHLSLGLILAISTAILATGGGAAWWALKSFTGSEIINHNPTNPSPNPVVTNPEQGVTKVEVYWLSGSEGEVNLVPQTLSLSTERANETEILNKAFELLLAGPSTTSNTTTIPSGTKLLSLDVKTDGIHLNFSQEFTSGGGSADMINRLAQVLYTATALEPEQPVWVDIDGKPLEYLGGEGVILDQPLTRQSFRENFDF